MSPVVIMARVGYFARGVVYTILGSFALLATIGSSEPEDSHGALEAVFAVPLGNILLAALATGLVAYSLWRLCQALLDADSHGLGFRAFFVRSGLFFSAVSHLLIAAFALTLLTGWPDGPQGDNGSTRWLMQQPYGQLGVFVVGGCVLGAGIAVVIKGLRAGFRKWIELDGPVLRWFRPICQFGLVTRGFIMLAAGGFLLLAAVQTNAGQARGLKGSLQWLQDQPFGIWLLGLAGVGMLSFAVYSYIAAVLRDIQGIEDW